MSLPFMPNAEGGGGGGEDATETDDCIDVFDALSSNVKITPPAPPDELNVTAENEELHGAQN
jgi:hypothetical protein